MKFVDLFAGIGGFRTGLEMAGHECVGFVEWDEFARKSYEAIHDTEGEWTARDITEVNEQDVPDHDVLTAGFPCQSFSVAGSRRGFEDTRGTLFFDVARIAKEKQPKIIMLENVKGLLSHDKGKTLDIIAKTLCDIGYTIDFEILNSKHFGVPQNRERIFIFAYRDDTVVQEPWMITDKGVKGKAKHRISAIEGIKTFNFDWPKNNEVTTRLRDILEVEVDEKFYLSEDKTSALVAKLSEETQKTEQMILDVSQYRKGEGDIREYTEIAPTLAARDYKEPRMVGHIGEQNMQGYRVYDKDGVGATIASQTGGLGGTGVTLVGVGHHPYSKQKEFDGYHDEPTPCLLASDYKAPKTIMTAEPQMLRPERTEYGKAIRKEYEAGEIEESRHNMRTLQPREDGVSNTLTTVLKDNLLAEPQMIGHVELNGHDLLKRVYSTEGISPTLTSMGGGNTEPKIAVVGSLKPEGATRIGTRDQVWGEWGIAGTLNASDYKQPRPIVQEIRPVSDPDRINKSQNGRRFKENDEESFTLTVQERHGILLSEPTDKIIKVAQLEGSHDQSGRIYDSKGIAPTIMSNSHGDTTGGYTPPKVVVEDIDRAIENCDSAIKQYEKFYDKNGYLPELFNPYNNTEIDEVAPTVTAQCTRINASSTVLKLLKLEGLPIREATKQGYALAEEGDAVNFQFPDSQTRRGRVGKQIAQTIEASGINQGVVEEVHSCSTRTRAYKGIPETLEIRKDAVSNSITSVAKDSYVLKTPKYRIRKLTPKECWFLQAYTLEQFEKAQNAGISNSQLYKQAGNSVTVNVIFELAKRL